MNGGPNSPQNPNPSALPPREDALPLRGEPEDPNKATLLEILRLLNQAEDEFEAENEKGLELVELEYRCGNYWAVKAGEAKLPVILELLMDNGMVDRVDTDTYSWIRKRQLRALYRITESGKAHLMKNITDEGRIE